MTEPTVAAGLLHGLVEFVLGRGASRADLAQRSGVDLGSLEDRDRRVPWSAYVAVMRTGQVLLDDPALSLHFGESTNMSDMSIVGLVGRACETVMDALELVNRYAPLLVNVECAGGGARFELVRSAGEVWLVDQRINPNSFHELTESTFDANGGHDASIRWIRRRWRGAGDACGTCIPRRIRAHLPRAARFRELEERDPRG